MGNKYFIICLFIQVQSCSTGGTGATSDLTIPLPTSRRKKTKLQRSVSERSDSDSSGIADVDGKSSNGQVTPLYILVVGYSTLLFFHSEHSEFIAIFFWGFNFEHYLDVLSIYRRTALVQTVA